MAASSVYQVCVCVLCFLEQQRSDLAMHVIKSSLQLFHGSTPWADVQYVSVHAVIEHTCSPDILTSCLSSLISNYFDILKPAESMLIRSSTSWVTKHRGLSGLRGVGGVQHATSSPLETERRPLPGVMRGAEVPWGGRTRRELLEIRLAAEAVLVFQQFGAARLVECRQQNCVFLLLRLLRLPITDLCTAILGPAAR